MLEQAVDLEAAYCDRYTFLPEQYSCRRGLIYRGAAKKKRSKSRKERPRSTGGNATPRRSKLDNMP